MGDLAQLLKANPRDLEAVIQGMSAKERASLDDNMRAIFIDCGGELPD